MTRKDDLFEQNDGNGEGATADQADDQTAAPETYTGETPGQILRAAREAKGLSTQQVADSLRLRNAVVELIEADEFDKLSSPTYVRGYLRSFSKALEVDEKRVFEAYRAMGFGEVAASTITMQSFSKRKVRERNDNRLMLISYLIIAIVIAMAVVWWWQDSNASSSAESLADQVFGSEQTTTNGQQSGNSEARTPVTPRVTESAVRNSALNSQDDAGATQNDAGATQRDADEADAAARDAAQVVTESPTSTSRNTGTEAANEATEATIEANKAVSPPESGLVASEAPTESEVPTENNTTGNADQLTMTFSDACWVKVTDATGEVIAIGTKVAGYTMPLNGQAPFDIILCKPEAVSITYNGELVDLSGYRRSRSVTMVLN